MSTLTLRLVKGTPLTNQEVDDNFSALNTDKLELADLIASAVTYDNTSSDLLAETVQAAIQELEVKKINTGDLRVGVTLFPTDTIYSGSEYLAVNDTADAEFNNTAVNIATGPVSTDGLIATVVSEDGIAEGEVTGVNVSLVGNIRKTVGNQNENSDFYFEVYHRDFQTSTDTLIGTSGHTLLVTSATYEEYAANAFIAGPVTFDAQDRIVLKFYAGDVTANSPEYDIQFGGTSPLRFSMPIALANVVQLENASDIIVASGTFSNILSATDTDVQTALETIDANAIGDAPIDTKTYVRSNGSWQELVIESERLEIAHHYHVRMHESLDKVYTNGAYYDSEFIWNIGTYTNGIYDYATSSSTFSKEFVHTLPDTAFTGDLDVKQLRWNANLAVADANIVEVKFALVAVEEFYGTERIIGETASQFVTNTAFNDFQFDFFGVGFTASGSTTVLPHEYLRVQGFIASPTGNSATLRIEHDPVQGNGEGWCMEVVNYDKGVSDITFPTMPWQAADGSGGRFQQWPFTRVDYNAGLHFRSGSYANTFSRMEFFGQGLVINYQGEFALNSTEVGGITDWSLRNVDIDVLEGNYDLAVNSGSMVQAASGDYTINFDSSNGDNAAIQFKIQSGNADVIAIPAPTSGAGQFLGGREWHWINAANTTSTVIVDGEAGTIQLNGANVLTVNDTPSVAGTEVVQKTSGMHWMPISLREETYFTSNTRNELGHAIPICDKNWTWEEYTVSGGAGVSTFVARIEFPQGAYVGETEDLGLTVQVRLRHNGSQPITQIQVGYGKRSPEGAESSTIKEPTAITSTTSAADYTAAAPTTAANLTITADDCMFVDVLIFAPNAWEAVISDTGNANDITTLLPVGVYAGSKRFIGAQDVHIGANDIRSVADYENRIDGQYVYVGKDRSLGTYVDGLNTTISSKQWINVDAASSITFKLNAVEDWRHDASGIRDIQWNTTSPRVPSVQFASLHTQEVRFYQQGSGYTTTFTGSSTTLTDADSLARQTDITNLQAQINALSANKVAEAPIDGKTYVRQNGEWIAVDLGLDLLIYPFDGGLSDTVYFAETMDGGASDTLVFDDAISPVLGGVSNSTYEVSPLISGLADMSTLAGANFNVDGGRASTTLFSSNFDGGAA